MPLSIAITLRADLEATQLWYSNGISQNIKFLYDLLELMGHRPVFLIFDDSPKHNATFKDKAYRVLSWGEWQREKPKLDLVLEAGVTVNHDFRAVFREHGTRIVGVKYGNDLFLDIEEMLFKNPETAGIVREPKPEALWISPHFDESKSYFEVLLDCPADFAPYLWEPDFVTGQFVNADRPSQLDIYVMEPNINVLKNAMIPMCIIEAIYRRDPNAFGKAMILNGMHFRDKPYFLTNIVRNLSSVESKANKVFFTERYSVDTTFKRPDVLVSHQWNCELNYLYLEVLWKGCALIHNSARLREFGYYYPDSEIHIAADQYLRLQKEFMPERVRYQSQPLLQRFSVHNPAVQQQYARLLDKAMSTPIRG